MKTAVLYQFVSPLGLLRFGSPARYMSSGMVWQSPGECHLCPPNQERQCYLMEKYFLWIKEVYLE
jgi:hypothetical protein